MPLGQLQPAERWTLTKVLKSAATLGLQNAYRELFDPKPILTGTVSGLDVNESVEIRFEPFWLVCIVAWIVGFALAFSLRTLVGFLILAAACVVLLLHSWRSSGKPFISVLSWLALSKSGKSKITELKLRVHDAEVRLIGELDGEAPEVGESVQVWGFYEDSEGKKVRAWKVQTHPSHGEQVKLLQTQRLLPLIPMLLFPYLAFALIALLRLLTGS